MDVTSKGTEVTRREGISGLQQQKNNVEKTAVDLSWRNWHLSGKATELLKSDEDKTKLQNHIEQTREKLGDVKREGEALNKKLGKVENDIQVLAMETMEVQKDMQSMEELYCKLQQHIIQEK
ncbi:kinesin-like protein KIN-12E [Forsythia ovata]|uniref:Kinesin-like protein KIN-12E n=1 Tax=Forsythia ovata TaxID=205694 RepID=A0ABD1X1G8_9LAMI